MAERTCECGCGRQIVGRRSGARYATDACKSRAWRASTGYRLSASRRGVRHDKSGRSGAQVSYRKAIGVVAGFIRFNWPDCDDAESRAEEILAEALPMRQRRRIYLGED